MEEKFTENVAASGSLNASETKKAGASERLNAWGARVYGKLPRPIKAVYAFVSREWLYFAATALIFALFFGVLYSMQIFPFSSDNMSNYDLLAQIVPFYEHFYDVLDGKSSLFYSPAIAGGADVFGTLAYCAVSPFTPLFLLFGRTRVYYAISFILPLKLSAIACAAIYFLKKKFPSISEVQMLVMGIAYSFCGYTFVANTYINWVDFLIYMPFVIIGFHKLVEEKRIRYFAVSYALMIYACFSIACFALFLIFPILLAYALIAADKSDRWEILSKSCLALTLSVALALPLLVPALLAYVRSGRNTGLFENMGNPLSANHIYAKFSYILSDTLFLFLTVVYFIKNGLKSKLNRFLLLAGVILLMPIFIDEVCNLMNAGSYMSYAERFGFLNSTYAFYVSARLLASLKEKPVNRSVNCIFAVILAVFTALACAFIILLNIRLTDPNYSLSESVSDFSGKFAHSLGGLEVIYQIALVVSGVLAVGALFYSFKLVRLSTVSYVLLCVIAVQVAFYNIHLVRGNSFNPLRYDQYNAIFAAVDEYDDRRYYRIKDNNAAVTNDAPLTTHTNSFGVFSSVIDGDNFIATNFFNYGGNRKNSIESAGGNFFGDCLLGFKYYYVHTDDTRAKYVLTNREYAVRLEDTAQKNFCAYENIGVFPNAYTVHGGNLKMDSGNTVADYEELYAFLGGEGPLFVTSYFSDSGERGSDKVFVRTAEDGRVCYKIEFNTRYTGEYFFEVKLPEGVEAVYNTSVSNDVFNLTYYDLENPGIWLNYSKKSSGVFHLNLMAKEGSQLDLETVIASVHGKIMTNDKILALSDKLRSRAVSYEQSRNKFTASVTAPDDQTYLFLNYVAIDGFEATVNGRRTEVIDNGIKFILVKLDEGENKVTITYKSPYPKYIIVGTVLGAAIILAVWLIYKKFSKAYLKLKSFICAAAVIIGVAVVGFFYVYPTAIFAEKLVKLLAAIK